MTIALLYAVIFTVAFGVAAIAVSLAWIFTEPRLDAGGPRLLADRRLSAVRFLSRALDGFSASDRLKRRLDEADLDWSVGRLTLTTSICAMSVFAALARVEGIPTLGAVAAALGAGSLPWLYVQSRCEKRLKAAEEQLPEALEFISRALIAGHSLPMTLELLADEIGQPLSGELRKTVDEYNLGTSIERSIENLSERLPSVDIRFFASAIATQSRTGGGLHELLENLATTIRERGALKGQVRALTANGRMTALVLSALPFFIAGVMLVINRDYFMLLAGHPIGKTLLFCALCGQVAAFFVIRKIADVRI